MPNNTSLDKLIKSVKNNINSNHVIILPKNISKKFVKNIISLEKIKNINIFYLDEYIFKINNENINTIRKCDSIYLESVLESTTTLFNKYNLTSEAENILNIIEKLFLENNIFIEKNNFSEDGIIKKLNQNLVSFESKIFLEIVKLWIQKSLDEGTLINKYLSFLNKEFIFFSNCRHYVINSHDYSKLEKIWIEKYLPNLAIFNDNNKLTIEENNYDIKNINSYNSKDFGSQEEELEYIAKNIIKIHKLHKYKRIALINNNRYFTRRLSAILDGYDIKINDNSGWLLSTSSCSSYIDNILNFYIKNYCYINLHDIVKSPYFMPNISSEIKNKFLDKVLMVQKNNVKADLLISENDIKDEEIRSLLLLLKNDGNFKDNVTFNAFKDFITNKIKDFDSKDLITNDVAGKKVYEALDHLSSISILKNNEENFLKWQEKLNTYLETKTFSQDNHSNIFYTDIKNARLCSFDKIFISSMNSKNFPKKNINNFSKKNIIYSEFSLDSSIEDAEDIKDFLLLSSNADDISLTFSSSDGDEYLSKSKFKNYVDYFIKDKNLKISTVFNSKKTKNITMQHSFLLDDSFNNLTYRDIENYNTCFYCFYINKKSPKKNQMSKISDDYFLFGNFVHAVLSDIITHKINMTSYSDIVKNLLLFTELREKDFFLKNHSPYNIVLWKKLLPKIANYFLADKSKKYNFSAEKNLKMIYKDTITLKGRYDLKYSCGNNICLVDYKTSSYLPSRKSVLSGESLQLPFYTLLDKNISLVEFLSINVSKNTILPTVFTSEELSTSRDVILNTVENIYKHLAEQSPLMVEKNSLGCDVCGYIDVNI